ncbi:MAG TPA: hypothetical protein VHO48_00730 [Anaerolineaceae bacterium]|nr:hypothetical protein [Anaerolineaceae bacterium]
MKASVRFLRFIVLVILVFSLSSCKLPSQVTPSPVLSEPTSGAESPRVLPTATLLVIPQATNTPVQPTPTLPPTQTPTFISTPTKVPTSTYTPVAAIVQTGRYAVVGVAENDVLQVHQTAGANAAVLGDFAYNAGDIQLTGKEATVDNARWVEALLPDGGSGWVNARYLTEMVSAAAFCADPQVKALLDNLKNSLSNKDGQAFAALISPVHGLNLRYLRGGTVANYSEAEASWVFNSSFVVNWGTHPGSGMDVKGTFSQEVLPKLLDVFAANYQHTCSEIVTGGASYTTDWPAQYANINFLSAYRPGAAGDELNWRTWLVGVEYVGGKPTLFALEHLFWEP